MKPSITFRWMMKVRGFFFPMIHKHKTHPINPRDRRRRAIRALVGGSPA